MYYIVHICLVYLIVNYPSISFRMSRIVQDYTWQGTYDMNYNYQILNSNFLWYDYCFWDFSKPNFLELLYDLNNYCLCQPNWESESLIIPEDFESKWFNEEIKGDSWYQESKQCMLILKISHLFIYQNS